LFKRYDGCTGPPVGGEAGLPAGEQAVCQGTVRGVGAALLCGSHPAGQQGSQTFSVRDFSGAGLSGFFPLAGYDFTYRSQN